MFGKDIPIIMVAGNHEHYRTGLSVADNIVWMRKDAEDEQAAGHPTYFLENDTLELKIKGRTIRFIGATLWTDFALFGDPDLGMQFAASQMADFRLIRGSCGSLTPVETAEWHLESRNFIERQLGSSFAGKTIVVTHHAPSSRSVPRRYASNPITPAFASRCDDLLDLGADLWVHGHTHDSFDYKAGATRVVCNPRGYEDGWTRRIENPRFNADFLIPVGKRNQNRKQIQARSEPRGLARRRIA